MNLLITNDDGIHATGINELAECLAAKHNVYVVAPDIEKSATSAAITLQYPLRIKEHKPYKMTNVKKYYHVNGTPADCVKIALKVVFTGENQPDMVISGINHGPNIGIDVRYSGTVAAAFEGAFAGFPAIAVSAAIPFNEPGHVPKFSAAVSFIRDNIEKLHEKCIELKNKCVLNINAPSADYEQIKGTRITRLNSSKYRDFYKEIFDPVDRTHYWLTCEKIQADVDDFTDDIAVKNGFVSITPLKYDQTDYEALAEFKTL